MSDFRKLLLAFAAVTLIAGIASAGPAPALNHTASPLSIRTETPMQEMSLTNLFPDASGCGALLYTTPTETPFSPHNPPQLIALGSPAITPAPNIASLNTGQTTLSANTALATGTTIAATPASIPIGSNSNNHTLGNPATDSSSVFNTTNAVASPEKVVVAPNVVAHAGQAFISAGNNAANIPVSAPAQVARSGPNNAGNNAG